MGHSYLPPFPLNCFNIQAAQQPAPAPAPAPVKVTATQTGKKLFISGSNSPSFYQCKDIKCLVNVDYFFCVFSIKGGVGCAKNP